MNKCTQQEFEEQLKEQQNNPLSGLTGPFIHSAPAGNIFHGPFKECAWMIEKATMLKKVWTPAEGWKFYQGLESANEGGTHV